MIAVVLALGWTLGAAAAVSTANPGKKPAISFGNGQKNWIVAAGATRKGSTFTFREAQIEGNGWLVVYQIVDGKPDGEKYLGASYVISGNSKNIAVTVDYLPKAKEHFLVMLHRDVNEDKVFDFVFVDPPNVLDKAVLEGNKMIARIFSAP